MLRTEIPSFAFESRTIAYLILRLIAFNAVVFFDGFTFLPTKKMFSRLVKQMAEREGETEALKTQNQMAWIGG